MVEIDAKLVEIARITSKLGGYSPYLGKVGENVRKLGKKWWNCMKMWQNVLKIVKFVGFTSNLHIFPHICRIG